MSGFYGADTDQLREHSALLAQRATAISELRDLLHPVVMDESAWHGPDADAFRSRWSSSTSPLFDEVQGQITRRSTELEIGRASCREVGMDWVGGSSHQ